MMKVRLSMLIVACSVALSIVGCGSNNKESNNDSNGKETKSSASESVNVAESEVLMSEEALESEEVNPQPEIANPFIEVSADELTKELGLSMGVPGGATNIVYEINQVENFGQMTFSLNGLTYVARIKATASYEDISGCFYEWTYESNVKVGYCEGKYYGYADDKENIDVCTWCDIVPGVSYSLFVVANDLTGTDITDVANEIFVPLQGDN